MEILQDIGNRIQANHYQLDSRKTYENYNGKNEPGWRNEKQLLKTPPVIKTLKTVDDIIGDDYDLYKSCLENYKKSGLGWDEYAIKAKLSIDVRETFKDILKRLHAHGFYGPEVIRGQIVCYQWVEKTKVKEKYQHRQGCKCLGCENKRHIENLLNR